MDSIDDHVSDCIKIIDFLIFLEKGVEPTYNVLVKS